MHDHKHAVDWAAIVPHMVGRQALEAPQQRQVIAWLGIKPGMVVADVGCGVGRHDRAARGSGRHDRAGDRSRRRTCDAGGDGSPRGVLRGCGVGEGARRRPRARGPCARSWVGRSTSCTRARSVHHLADEVAGLRRLATALRPEGRLVVLEGGLDSRYLPADCGLGRPGLEGRIADAQEDWFWSIGPPTGSPGPTRSADGLERQARSRPGSSTSR